MRALTYRDGDWVQTGGVIVGEPNAPVFSDFGRFVSLSGDGATIAVGTLVFRRVGLEWVPVERGDDDASQGGIRSVDLDSDGTTLSLIHI